MARRVSSGGKRPLFSVPRVSGYVISKFDRFWARREEVCLRYLEALSGANVHLSDGTCQRQWDTLGD